MEKLFYTWVCYLIITVAYGYVGVIFDLGVLPPSIIFLYFINNIITLLVVVIVGKKLFVYTFFK
jgi:hypothetical protein